MGGDDLSDVGRIRNVEVGLEGDVVEQHGGGDVDLSLGAKDGDNVGRRLLVGEPDGRVCLALNVVDEDGLLAEKSSVVAARDGDALEGVVLVL